MSEAVKHLHPRYRCLPWTTTIRGAALSLLFFITITTTINIAFTMNIASTVNITITLSHTEGPVPKRTVRRRERSRSHVNESPCLSTRTNLDTA